MQASDPNAPLSFRSVQGHAVIEKTIERSRFIGFTWPVTSVAEATAHIEDLRILHPEATHIVPAWIIGAGGLLMRAIDDGEPNGTAGLPMLEVLKRANLTDCLVVVVRYFGGIKLGAGGLIRAYRSTASETIQTAGIAIWRQHRHLTLTLPYPLQNLFEHRLAQSPWQIAEIHYDASVHMHLQIPLEDHAVANAQFTDWSQGQAVLSWGELSYQPALPDDEKERPPS